MTRSSKITTRPDYSYPSFPSVGLNIYSGLIALPAAGYFTVYVTAATFFAAPAAWQIIRPTRNPVV